MEDRISNLEDRNIEMPQMEEERELRLKRNEEILWEVADSIRKYKMRIIGISEGERSRELVQRNNSGEFPKPEQGAGATSKRS